MVAFDRHSGDSSPRNANNIPPPPPKSLRHWQHIATRSRIKVPHGHTVMQAVFELVNPLDHPPRDTLGITLHGVPDAHIPAVLAGARPPGPLHAAVVGLAHGATVLGRLHGLF